MAHTIDDARRVRNARAEHARTLKAFGKGNALNQIADIVEAPDVIWRRAKVERALKAVPYLGPSHTARLVREAVVSPKATLEDLTPRQREELARALRRAAVAYFQQRKWDTTRCPVAA